MTVQKDLLICFKSGYECHHMPIAKSEEEWWDFVAHVTNAVNRGSEGVLVTQKPYGMHRISDISALHFGDTEPPPDTPPIGFQLPEA